MFKGLFKKRNSHVPKKEENQTPETKPARDPEELKQELHHLQQQLRQAEDGDKITILNNLGQIYQELGDADQAIQYFEKSLAEKEQFGSAYNGLLFLYDRKRQEAARAKNDDEIQKWVSKMDRLVDMSKRVMRSSLS
ncbi:MULTISPECIES: tetratricopeptide repeat protein [unclassified Sporolactobacillus]|uniref:tetratricopeptide repeat protein n=1 Tax=unclassified Sporolactobacillus TaxID=2628533 RepID=UPI002368A3CA|nr:tetratricopeptide repeat protein [Sporolactobacillus sp. CQH2019]MDD9150289.1 tetratricopeptide repeat protein [Sporolactobacillus sp. CQH2019]